MKNLFNANDAPSVIGTGLVALDVVINSDQKTKPRLHAGGTCGNVLSILSYLGWKAFPVARIGVDHASRLVLRDLKKCGVRIEFLSLKPVADTPIIIQKIKRLASGEMSHRFSFTCPNCGAWLPSYKPVLASSILEILPRIESPKVFFFDRVSRGAIELAKACADSGAIVVFEPSGMGDPKLFSEAMEYVHILKYSNERMHEMSDKESVSGPLLIIETMGAEGLRYRGNLNCIKKIANWQNAPAIKIDGVKDSAGAGDWCTAGILHLLAARGLLGFQGTSLDALRKAIKFGQAMAALNCRYEGARGVMYELDAEQFKERIKTISFSQSLGTIVELALEQGRRSGFECIAPTCTPNKTSRKNDVKQQRRGKRNIISHR